MAAITTISDCLLPRHGCCGYKGGVLEDKTKVDEEDDADAEGEDTGCDGVVGESKTADGEEENAADEVEEELEAGDAAANNVVDQDAGDDDGIADNDSLPKNKSFQKNRKKVVIPCQENHHHPCPSPSILHYHQLGRRRTCSSCRI